MKKLVVLGGGTAGTMVVNKLSKVLPKDWHITVVDQDKIHIYQPGLLLMPFGVYEPEQLIKPRENFFPKSVNFVQTEIERVNAETNEVILKDGQILNFIYNS